MTDDLTIQWDIGTAVDFFVSLVMLHDPSTYGLRAAWAAGMRSRLPNADRETLEDLKLVIHYPPFHWLYGLPEPKDGSVVLTELANTPPQERLAALYLKNEADWEPGTIVRRVAEQGSYTDEDVSAYRAAYAEHRKKLTSKDAAATLAIWADHAAYGERLLSALRSYYEVFFVEEERRIRPALKAALDDAQEKAARMNFDELIEDLSQGVAFDVTDPGDETDTVILAPSFWSAPLIWFGNVDQHTRVIYFGARPANASLVPGEVVPDALVSVLKALSDPTRLRIMHYLATDSLTPTQLANRLRLRPPTVVHHLKVMRLAGLVRVRISEGKEKSYAARTETVESTFEILRGFIKFGGSDLVGLASSFAEENSS